MISTFYVIFSKIIENHSKVKNKPYTDDKKNFNEIKYNVHNQFYLEHEDIFSIFNNNYNELGIIKILQLMATIYNEYVTIILI